MVAAQIRLLRRRLVVGSDRLIEQFMVPARFNAINGAK